MRKKVWLILTGGLLSVALLAPAPSSADTNMFGRCPDGYMPIPFFAAPEEDSNGNGVVCMKVVPSGQENTHDDPNGTPYDCNGFPSPPEGCSPGNVALIVDDYLPL